MTGYLPKKLIAKRNDQLLDEIKAVFPEQDSANPLREALTGSAHIIATHLVWSELLSLRCYQSGVLFLLLSALVVPGSTIYSLLESIGPGPFPEFRPVTLAVIFALLFWVYWVGLLHRLEARGFPSNSRFVLGLVVPVGSGFLLQFIPTRDWQDTGFLRFIRVIVEAGPVFSAILGIVLSSVVITSAFDAVVENIQRRCNPRAHFMKALFDALQGVIALNRDDELGWPHPKARAALIANMEEAARCLEVIPKVIAGRDHFSSIWNRQAYLCRASGIRDRKKWVLLPKSETRIELERELRRILQLAAIGDWDGLPQAELPKDAPVPWWQQALMIIRSLIIAAAPPVGVTIFGKYLPQEFKTPVTDASWILALLSILVMLDPRLGEKVSAFKDLPSYFPFGRKPKE